MHRADEGDDAIASVELILQHLRHIAPVRQEVDLDDGNGTALDEDVFDFLRQGHQAVEVREIKTRVWLVLMEVIGYALGCYIYRATEIYYRSSRRFPRYSDFFKTRDPDGAVLVRGGWGRFFVNLPDSQGDEIFFGGQVGTCFGLVEMVEGGFLIS